MDEYIFLCFSGKERLKYVESIHYHLENFGLKVWYDYEKILLGDNGDYINIENGVYKSNIFILFISNNLLKSSGALLELQHIKKLINIGKIIHIIPILCDINITQIPKCLNWINNYIYGECKLDNSTGTYDLAIDIYNKLLKILCEKENVSVLETINTKDEFLENLNFLYLNIDNHNTSAKITLLYTMIIYNNIINNHCNKYLPLLKGINRLYNKANLNIEYSIKEVKCIEYLATLLFV